MAFSKRQVELSPKLKLGVGRAHGKGRILKLTGVFLLLASFVFIINIVHLVISHQPTGQVLGATDTKTASDITQYEFVEYKVQKGDTLFNISQRYNIPWQTLATLNNLQTSVNLKVGQILKIPKQ